MSELVMVPCSRQKCHNCNTSLPPRLLLKEPTTEELQYRDKQGFYVLECPACSVPLFERKPDNLRNNTLLYFDNQVSWYKFLERNELLFRTYVTMRRENKFVNSQLSTEYWSILF